MFTITWTQCWCSRRNLWFVLFTDQKTILKTALTSSKAQLICKSWETQAGFQVSVSRSNPNMKQSWEMPPAWHCSIPGTIQCQPQATEGAWKGLSKPACHPEQGNVQKSQGLGLSRMAFFPLYSLAIIHGLWFLGHPITLISIKPLPLFPQPFSALTACSKGGTACLSCGHNWQGAAGPPPLPFPNRNKHPPRAVSAEQHPEPCSRAARASMGSEKGALGSSWEHGQSFCAQPNQEHSFAAVPQQDA